MSDDIFFKDEKSYRNWVGKFAFETWKREGGKEDLAELTQQAYQSNLNLLCPEKPSEEYKKSARYRAAMDARRMLAFGEIKTEELGQVTMQLFARYKAESGEA